MQSLMLYSPLFDLWFVALDVQPSFSELVEKVEGSADEETGRNINQRYNGCKSSIVSVCRSFS